MKILGLALALASLCWAQKQTHPHVLSIRVDFPGRLIDFKSQDFTADEQPQPDSDRDWHIDADREIMLRRGASSAETRYFDNPKEQPGLLGNLQVFEEIWSEPLSACLPKPERVIVATVHPKDDVVDFIMSGGARLEVRGGAVLWRDKKPCPLLDEQTFYQVAIWFVRYASESVAWWDRGLGVKTGGGRSIAD